MPAEAASIAAIRRFNRLYTRQIGVLDRGILKSEFSLAEVRVLYELAHADRPTAAQIGKAVGLDAGYLSRIIGHLVRAGLVQKSRSEVDARQMLLELTGKGRRTFAKLDARANDEIRGMLDPLSEEQRRRLVSAVRVCEDVLAGASARVPYVLRDPLPGELGWVVARHGAIYADEYGWGERFEALVARIVAEYVERFDPKRERCWIAERDGTPVGSVFLVKKTETIAQLRLLLVEPSARGLGIGGRLVDECTRFARLRGYRRIQLWTNHVLVDARRIYERAGYRMIKAEPHQRFGKGLVGQTWELRL